jgi:hypothetical protein
MHDLVPALIDPGSVPAIGTLTTDEMAATMAYAEAQHSAATLEAYASDWQQFAQWCASRGATALPAHPGMVGLGPTSATWPPAASGAALSAASAPPSPIATSSTGAIRCRPARRG